MDFEKRIRLVPCLTSVTVFITSLGFLILWVFVPSMKEFSAGSMKFNTAFGLMTCSAALFLQTRNFPGEKRGENIARILGAMTFLIGLLTSLEYFLNMNLGIDESFVSDFSSSESLLHPGRMSPIAAVCFMIAGLSELLVNSTSAHLKKFSKILSFLLFYITVFCLIGYLYQEKSFYKIGPYIRISWQSILSFMILSFGLLFETKHGVRTLLASEGLGGMISRRLLPLVIVIPACLGNIWIYLRRSDIIGRELGVSLFVVFIIAIFFAMITFISRRLNGIEAKLQQAVVVRDEFLSIASHELKTPLTSLKLQNEIHEKRMKEGDQKVYEKAYLLKIARSVDKHTSRFNHLINDMLDISRMQSGKFTVNREELDLCLLTAETIDEMMLTTQGIETPVLEIPTPVRGSWDRLRIEQVITNLMTNAVRYGEGRSIHVKVCEKEGVALLIVKDHGIGISPDNFGKIFDRFERVDARSNNTGLGLGLFISKQIVDAHHGRIELVSKLGEGSTFTVILPQS